MQIVIIGAGPTGLTTAVELARQGIIPTVIERQPEASTLSRAVGILPRSLQILNPSGVSEQLLAEGIQMRTIEIYQGRRKTLALPLQGAHPINEYVLALAQDRTEAILRDALVRYGGSVKYGTEFTNLQQDGQQVIVQTADGQELACDYLIGADGTRSTTRESLGVDFPGYELERTWSIADVDAEGWSKPETFVLSLVKKGGVVVVVPLEKARYRIISNTEDALATLPLKLNVTNIRRAGTFRIAIRQVHEYAKGRVLLAGDAAHCHSPVGGRGMNLGIDDAAELAKRLVEGRLDGYSVSRHKVGAETITASENARKLFTASRFFNRTLLTLGLRAVNWLPFVKRRIAKTFLGN